MKKTIFTILLLLFVSALAFPQCKVTLSPGVSPDPAGFCIHFTVEKLSTGTYSGLYEIDYVNPGTTEPVRLHDPGLWQGAGGDGCWAPSYDQQYTLFAGIKSGAQVRARSLNFYIGEYGDSNAAWAAYKDDPSKWCAWSAWYTVTFTGSSIPAKPKKK